MQAVTPPLPSRYPADVSNSFPPQRFSMETSTPAVKLFNPSEEPHTESVLEYGKDTFAMFELPHGA